MRQRAGDGPFLDHNLGGEATICQQQRVRKNKKVLKGCFKTHHNYKVQDEEKGNAAGVAQKACQGERQIW